MNNWIKAFRLRTLPLAASGIMLGSAVAYNYGKFSVIVFILALVTTFLLQILSNLANDYGDFKNGIDNDNRIGPKRTVQSGSISVKSMKKAIILFALLSFAFGISLLLVAFDGASVKMLLYFLTGLLGIVAALKYTVGKSNFGYKGFGDIVVFIFFGPVAVCGVYFLHTFNIDYTMLLPATAIGLLSSGVLNINNMRDFKNDKLCGKNTLIVKIGFTGGKVYHTVLILSSIALSVLFFVTKQIFSWLVVLPYILLFIHLTKVLITKEPVKLDPELKRLAIFTFILSLTICLVFMFKFC